MTKGREAVQAEECYRLEKAFADKIYRIQITLFPTAAASTRTYSLALASLHRITLLFAGL
jgi:hypothetical protein